MPKIEIYTTPTCPYCVKAKKLLDSKEVQYEEIDVDTDEVKYQEMIKRSGRKTVPEIFIDGKFIGGCDDLCALEKEGKLDPLLK